MSKPIKNNSKLLYLQARQLFEEAKERFEDGTIMTERRLIDSVFNAFQDFFTSMGKPKMVPRYAPEEGPPWSEDYNDMMNEIRQDLELLFQEVDILGQSLYTDFNHNMIQHEIVNKQFEDVLDKMRDLEIYAGIGETGVEYGRDDFLNKSKIDYSRISGTPLEIVDGAVTLPQVNRINVAKKAKVTIVVGNRKQNKFILGTESNGFPGNSTEIHSVTDDILTNRNYIPTFLGEENNHGDYTAVLDGSPNTWFEYEKVNVREHDKIRVAKNLGWDYQVHGNQTIAWAEDPDDGILKLHMQLILNEETIINQINCNMYTPPNYNAKTAIVKNILVSDGKGVPKSVLPKNRKQDDYQFHFPPVKAKVVSILFEQPHKYITDIGHIFYEKRMDTEDKSEYAMDMAAKKYKYAPRVEGPLISLEDLGINVKVSPSNVEASYPLLSEREQNPTNIGETINRLMGNVDAESVDMGVEKFEGFRWCIGVRDIEVFSCAYATEGELVTHPFYFEKPLDKISLQVNENIPSAFAENDAMKYDWLHYFVSIDDGATWHPITPISHEVFSEEQPPKIYTVRMIEKSNQKLDYKKAYIESEYPVYSIRLKIVGRRPDGDMPKLFSISSNGDKEQVSYDQASPILNSYMFDLTSMYDIADSEESTRIPASIGSESPDPGHVPGLPGDSGGSPSDDPWGDDNGDGIPNWDDPSHPGYQPIPPGEPQPPGNPGTFPDYPIVDKDRLKTVITNKKTEWCMDEELQVKGYVSSIQDLVKAELLVNGEVKTTLPLKGKTDSFVFKLPANTYPVSTITVVVRGYDKYDMAVDTDIINIVDCIDLPPEDKPKEKEKETLNIVIDKKSSDLCECDDLSFYGSVQGPHPIQSILFYINDTLIDPNNLGTPPTDHPCDSSVHIESHVTIQQTVTDEELLEIEDFGDWLEAFEEKHDCGCKNKEKEPAHVFKIQSSPSLMTADEKLFHVRVPYWKLYQLGASAGSSVNVSIIAHDAVNSSVTETFSVMIKDCDKPPVDENGNPRVRDCYLLESIEVHYFDQTTQSIQSKVIPANALPYEHIENGAGSGVTVGWKKEEAAPILMQTKGYDESGFTFQVHAVGVHYLNEYDQPNVVWTTAIGEASSGIKNKNRMIGDPTKSSPWADDIVEFGDYSLSPSFSRINDYATFIMENDWIQKSCPVEMNFEPTQYEKPESPDDEGQEEIHSCNRMTHIIFQSYDEAARQLKLYKIDITSTGKDTYEIVTKNGTMIISLGWVDYFKAPAIQIKSGAGVDNILLTAMGVVYVDIYGQSKTAWSTQLRYKTNGVRYPEFVLGDKKDISDIEWVENGVVNYELATYIGRQGDMVSYSVDEVFSESMCDPEKTVDDEMGIDPNTPLGEPRVEFLNIPGSVCVNEGLLEIEAVVKDDIAIKRVRYGILVNGAAIYGPFEDQIDDSEYTIGLPLDSDYLEEGDTIQLRVEATNVFNATVVEKEVRIASNCDIDPPVIEATIAIDEMDGKYCYSHLVQEKMPISLQVTDDRQLIGWEVSCGSWKTETDYTDQLDAVSDSGVIRLEVPVSIPQKKQDAYERFFIPDSSHTITIKAYDRSGKQSTKTISFTLTDCQYDPSPPHSIAQATGNVFVDAKVNYTLGTDIDMGDFMSEWTEWHLDGAGNWTTVNNAGRTELTNTLNQNGYSGWYNSIHADLSDYYFEMKYQARAGDDDVMGAFFRTQFDDLGNIQAFYSIEHDGTASWVNSSGFRIIKHLVDGKTTIKTVLAESTTAGWTMNDHRAYKITASIEGNKFIVDLYGESTLARPVGEPAVEPYNWVHLKTLVATDNEFTGGPWGPMTNSNPESYFWDLRVSHLAQITSRDERALNKSIPINVKEKFGPEDRGQTKEIQLTSAIEPVMRSDVDQALLNQGILRSQVVGIEYAIVGSTLKDVKNNAIGTNQLLFNPNAGIPYETVNPSSVIKGRVTADFL